MTDSRGTPCTGRGENMRSSRRSLRTLCVSNGVEHLAEFATIVADATKEIPDGDERAMIVHAFTLWALVEIDESRGDGSILEEVNEELRKLSYAQIKKVFMRLSTQPYADELLEFIKTIM